MMMQAESQRTHERQKIVRSSSLKKQGNIKCITESGNVETYSRRDECGKNIVGTVANNSKV
jgi:hypothetical protein